MQFATLEGNRIPTNDILHYSQALYYYHMEFNFQLEKRAVSQLVAWLNTSLGHSNKWR